MAAAVVVERPPDGADHANRDRVGVAERIADRDDPVAGGHLRGIAELGLAQRMLRHLGQLDQRAVGERIPADHLGGVGVVVFVAQKLHFDLGRVLDHVVVGQDEAVLRADDEAGAGGCRFLLALGPAAAPGIVLLILLARAGAEEPAEEVVRRTAAAAAEEVLQILRLGLHLGADVDDHRRLRLRDVAERLGVDRSADRRAVHRRHRDRLCRGGRRQLEPGGDDQRDGKRRDGGQQDVKERGLARGHRIPPTPV